MTRSISSLLARTTFAAATLAALLGASGCSLRLRSVPATSWAAQQVDDPEPASELSSTGDDVPPPDDASHAAVEDDAPAAEAIAETEHAEQPAEQPAVPEMAKEAKEAKEAGPIWNQDHAQQICPNVCGATERWTGHWWTTQWNKMSVCECLVDG